MKQRVITGLLFGIVTICAVLIGGLIFTLLVSAVASIAMIELLKMKKIKPISFTGLVGLISMWLLLVPAPWVDIMPSHFTKVELFVFLILVLLMFTVLTKKCVYF